MKNLEELKGQLSTVKSQVDAKMTELYEAGVAYPEMNEEVAKLNNQITVLNNEITESRKDLVSSIMFLRKENIKKEISDIDVELNNKITELQNNGNQYPEMDQSIINLNAKKSSLQKEVLDIEAHENNKVTSNIEKLEQKYNETKTSLEARQNELYNSGNQYPEMDQEVIKLNSELLSLTKEISDLHNKLIVDAYVTKKEDLETQLADLENSLNNRMTELNNDGNAYPQMDNNVIELNNSITSIKESINKLSNEYENNLLTDNIFETIELPKIDQNIKEDFSKSNDNEPIVSNESSVVEPIIQEPPVVDQSNSLNTQILTEKTKEGIVEPEIDQPTISENINTLETNNIDPAIEESSTIDNNSLNTQLLSEKKKLEIQLNILDKFAKGEMDQTNKKSESFDSRIAKLESQIEKLNLNRNVTKHVDPAQALSTSRDELEEMLIDKESSATKEEKKAIETYRAAASLPTVENVIASLNSAAILPDNSSIKNSLIDTITKIEAAYIKDDDEIKMSRDRMAELNIKPFESTITNSFENEIAELVQQIQSIKNEKAKREKTVEKIKQKIEAKIFDIDEKLGNNKESNNKEQAVMETEVAEKDEQEIPPELASDDKSNNLFNRFTDKLHELADKKAEAKEQQVRDNADKMQELANYSNKLHQIAEEDRIFNDENRVEKDNNWMEQKTARSLGKFNDKNPEIASVEANKESIEPVIVEQQSNQSEESNKEEVLPTFADDNDDKFKVPHVIKQIQKAPQKLLEKISKSTFAEKVTKVLECLQKAKVAVATATMIIGAGILSSSANQNINVEASTDTVDKTQTFVDTTNNIADNIQKINDTQKEIAQANVKVSFDNSDNALTQTAEDIDFNNALQQQINEILNGQTGVYTSSDRAISGTDMKMPTASQIDNSWKEAQPGAYYDAEGNKISETDAMNIVESGEQVAARMDNDRGTAGYINIGATTEENTQGMSR